MALQSLLPENQNSQEAIHRHRFPGDKLAQLTPPNPAVSLRVPGNNPMEYKNTPWVPVVSYSAAGLIGASRITENKHWFTDVVAGAALGYLCGRQVVNNYHRYATLKSQRAKGKLSFNIGYSNGTLMPDLVYTFR